MSRFQQVLKSDYGLFLLLNVTDRLQPACGILTIQHFVKWSEIYTKPPTSLKSTVTQRELKLLKHIAKYIFFGGSFYRIHQR